MWPVSSPETRGCSGVLHERDLGHGVLPASARVFRAGVHRVQPGAGPLRRRGGVPATVMVRLCGVASSRRRGGASASRGVAWDTYRPSPQGRGCSAVAVASAPVREVLPAVAGVPATRTAFRLASETSPDTLWHDGDRNAPQARCCRATRYPERLPLITRAGESRGLGHTDERNPRSLGGPNGHMRYRTTQRQPGSYVRAAQSPRSQPYLLLMRPVAMWRSAAAW